VRVLIPGTRVRAGLGARRIRDIRCYDEPTPWSWREARPPVGERPRDTAGRGRLASGDHGRISSGPYPPAAVQHAIEVTSGKGVRTRDVGGSASTEQVTAAIIENLLV
jgi:hypothetical protein